MKKNYRDKINEARLVLENAELVIIGGGAGLSMSAGINYSGERFDSNFSDFKQRYNLTDMYSAGFYPFETQEEKWAYWSRHIKLNRYDEIESNLYPLLFGQVKAKDYFVLTTNVDYQFYKAGFSKDRVFAVQGDYGKIQCSVPCHKKLYSNKDIINEMVAMQKECKVPSNLVPKCPRCSSNMEVNIRKDDTFVQDLAWYKSLEGYNKFNEKISGRNIVLLELGVGYNTPSIIKYPFESMVSSYHNVSMIRVNMNELEVDMVNSDRVVNFNNDISEVLLAISQV